MRQYNRAFYMSLLTVLVGMAVLAHPAQAVNWSKCQVQQGNTAIPSGSFTTIMTLPTALKDVKQAFILSYSSGDYTVQSGYNHMVSSAITNTTTVTFKRLNNSGIAYVSYSVVECFENEFVVQSGTISIGNAESTKTGSLLSSAEITKSFVIASVATSDSTATQSTSMVTASLDSNTTVRVRRAATSAYTAEVKFQVVTFAPESGVTVQTNETGQPSNVELSSSKDSASFTLATPVDRSSSWVYCTYDAANNGLMQTAVGCELDSTANNVVKVHRYNAQAFTNRIRYYVITWPVDTVTVEHGSVDSDLDDPDDTIAKSDDITIGAVSNLKKAFSYVTMTTKGTGTLFPRNRWIYYLYDKTTLRTTFWRSDPGDYDASKKYWQVIQFPSPYQVTGWGWIGSSNDGINGTALISFSCDNLISYYGTACGDGTGGTRFDYGVYLEHGGGCGTACAISGTAWVGIYDSTDSQIQPLGIITFDPDVSSPSLPATLGNDITTVGEDESKAALWNEQTNELYGWARFLTLEDYEKNNADVASAQNNWGWIKLRGQVSGGSATEYGVDFDPVTSTFAEGSWAWNDNGTAANGTTELEGSGFGWVRFDLGTSGTVSQAWLKTSYGDVYSQGGIEVNTDATESYGDYGATYLILTNGNIINFYSQDFEKYTSQNTDLGGIPTETGTNVYRSMLGSIHVNELIDPDHREQHLYINNNSNCDDTWLRDHTNPLGGAVYYCVGNLTINNNLTFYNATGAGLGAGTIVVGGDLIINDNMGYYNNTIDQNINNLASVAFIVQGRVEINPTVTELVGAYIVLGDANAVTPDSYDFSTGGSDSGGYNAPLELAGLVMARSFHFQRNSQGDASDPQPSEHIYYDGRIFANTPPGLEDFAAVLPSFN